MKKLQAVDPYFGGSLFRSFIHFPCCHSSHIAQFFLCYEIFNLSTVPTNSKVFLRGLLTMREKQILTSVIEIQKANWE